MAEWSIAAVLKTVELRGSGGSNPSLSAKMIEISEQIPVSSTLTGIFCFRASAKKGVLMHISGGL